MNIKPITTHHFVKSEDLNQHGTLFAGRAAEWFVEAGLIAAAVYVPPERIVCLKLHGMTFTRPVRLGDIVQLTGRAVLTGKSRLVTNVCMCVRGEEVVCGFITFVNVDQEGHSFPHGIEIEPITAEEMALQEQARNLQ